MTAYYKSADLPKIYPNHLLFQIVQQVDKVSLHCTVRCYKDLIFYNFETFCVTACLHYRCLITLNVELSTATKRKKRWKKSRRNLANAVAGTCVRLGVHRNSPLIKPFRHCFHCDPREDGIVLHHHWLQQVSPRPLGTGSRHTKKWPGIGSCFFFSPLKTTLENLLQGLVPTARTYKTPSVNNVYIKPGFENTAYGHLALKVQCCPPPNLLASILLHFCWPLISFSWDLNLFNTVLFCGLFLGCCPFSVLV